MTRTMLLDGIDLSKHIGLVDVHARLHPCPDMSLPRSEQIQPPPEWVWATHVQITDNKTICTNMMAGLCKPHYINEPEHILIIRDLQQQDRLLPWDFTHNEFNMTGMVSIKSLNPTSAHLAAKGFRIEQWHLGLKGHDDLTTIKVPSQCL